MNKKPKRTIKFNKLRYITCESCTSKCQKYYDYLRDKEAGKKVNAPFVFKSMSQTKKSRRIGAWYLRCEYFTLDNLLIHQNSSDLSSLF